MEMENLKVKTNCQQQSSGALPNVAFFTHPKFKLLKGSFSPHKFMILKTM